MSETRTPIQVQHVRLRWFCEEPGCGAEMIATGSGHSVGWGSWWHHRCENGHTVDLPRAYPTVKEVYSDEGSEEASDAGLPE